MASYAPRTLEKPPLVPLSPLVEFDEAAIATAVALADRDGCCLVFLVFQMAERGMRGRGGRGPRVNSGCGVNEIPPRSHSYSGVGGMRHLARHRSDGLGAPGGVRRGAGEIRRASARSAFGTLFSVLSSDVQSLERCAISRYLDL